MTQGIQRYKLFGCIAFAIIAADQLSKYWISSVSGLVHGYYPPYGGFEIIPGFFSIVYNTNTGAAWGMFAGQRFILAALGLLAVAAIILFRHKLELEKKLMQVIFGLMTGGIIGNLVDRALFGSVTDFLDFHIGQYRWPTFNIADSSMVIAVGIYFVVGFFCQNKEIHSDAQDG